MTFNRSFLLLFPLLCSFNNAVGQQPNYVEQIIYDDNGTQTPTELKTKTFSDGLGKTLQSHTLINTSGYIAEALVSGTIYDALGRPSRTIVPFLNASYNYLEDISTLSNSSHNNSYAYSETRYSDDPESRIIAASAPGRSYSFDGDENGTHHAEFWYFGVASDACIPCSELSDNNLDARQNDEDARYFLAVTKDPNGNFSQVLKDMDGNVVKIWNHPEQRGKAGTDQCDNAKALISRSVYDITGRLVEEYSPDPNMAPTKYEYNTLGQLISKTSPDAGIVYYLYSETGVLDTIEDGVLRNYVRLEDIVNRAVLVNTLDFADRVTCTYIDKILNVDGSHRYSIKTRQFYDNPSAVVEYICPANSSNQELIKLRNVLTNAANNASYPQNTQGRLVASICYGELCNAVTDLSNYCNTFSDRIIEVFSYNDEGAVSTKYKYIPGLPLQVVKLEYDNYQGKLLREEITYGNSTNNVIIRQYMYDNNGRIWEVHVNGSRAIQYEYDRKGRLTAKTFYASDGSAINSMQTGYDELLNRVTSITTPLRFSESITYLSTQNDGLQKDYIGNITKTEIYQPTGRNQLIDLNYVYDDINRLKQVVHNNPIEDDISFRASYTYDNVGRFVNKQEGRSSLQNYVYERDGNNVTNRLSHINSKDHGKNYFYDPNGNMVFDRSKKLGLVYDWRNLPVEFRFYSSVPANVNWYESGCLDKKRSGIRLISRLKMVYDISGNRVIKEELK
jgi:YD repeat-containing protein